VQVDTALRRGRWYANEEQGEWEADKAAALGNHRAIGVDEGRIDRRLEIRSVGLGVGLLLIEALEGVNESV